MPGYFFRQVVPKECSQVQPSAIKSMALIHEAEFNYFYTLLNLLATFVEVTNGG